MGTKAVLIEIDVLPIFKAVSRYTIQKGPIRGYSENDLAQYLALRYLELDPMAKHDPRRGDRSAYLKMWAFGRIGELRASARRHSELDDKFETTEKVRNGESPTVESVVDARMRLEDLCGFVEKHLPPEEQELFELSFIKGLPASEVAKKLKMNTKKVFRMRSKILRALRDFANRLYGLGRGGTPT